MPSLPSDLRLLDLLDEASTPTAIEPTAAQLLDRVTELARDQGMAPTPEQAQGAVRLYQAQRSTDKQLVGLLERLPAADVAQGHADRLLERLQAICVEQKVDVAPANLTRAVTLYRDQQRPFRLWGRPATEEARKAALEAFGRYEDFPTMVGGSILITALCGSALSLFSLLFADLSKGGGGVCIGWAAGLFFGGLVFSGLGALAAEGLRNDQLPSPYRSWFKGGTWSQMKKLHPMEPNAGKLKAWLAHPRAAVALKLLSKTSVPLLVADAERLDGILEETLGQERAVQAAREKEIWNQGLQQMREST